MGANKYAMYKGGHIPFFILGLFLSAGPLIFFQIGCAGKPLPAINLDIEQTLEQLLQEEDADGDKKITIDDVCPKFPSGCDKRFPLHSSDDGTYEVSGTYYLSNLLQELKMAQEEGRERIDRERIFENPVQRITRSIREIYWRGLTRRIDGPNLESILGDEKISSTGVHYLYIPATDPDAFRYFSDVTRLQPELKLQVVLLPENITPQYVAEELAGKHGLLTLKLERDENGTYSGIPFVVPGGRFNEMYGWDSYFEALGLIRDGYVQLAKAMVDNFVYQITHYGKILNANRTYYLTRSQPPFLTSMALAVYEELPKNPSSKQWLENVFRCSIKEYHQVWMNEDHLTDTGLSRYFGTGLGPPPEVEPGHFDPVYTQYSKEYGIDVKTFEEKYKEGIIDLPELNRFFVHDRATRESGHDTTYRWNWDGDRCADFVTVDLNSLLFKIETDIAETIEKEFDGALSMTDGSVENSPEWKQRAEKRKRLMTQYLWDDDRGMFFDYDYKIRKSRHAYVSATTFYPLWAGLASEEQASAIIARALPALEMPGGISASSEKSLESVETRPSQRQWDYPNGWAPHQMLVWQGLTDYGYDLIAQRLIYRWLYSITRNAADYNGTIPEKMDVVKRSHQVFAEYGNVGTKFQYITREGFGWMNASYQVGLGLLSENLRDSLERLIPPEWIFD
ncbi:MAG: trehalase family glycosidase [Acidobacteriota bacterium]